MTPKENKVNIFDAKLLKKFKQTKDVILILQERISKNILI
jgi:hypothetical protein